MRVDHAELAWAAGFWDGEGSTSIHTQKHSEHTYHYPKMSIGQVNPKPLYRFQAALGGLGTVNGPYDRKSPYNKQPIYIWHLHRWQYVQQALACLWSNISEEKQMQAKLVFRGCV